MTAITDLFGASHVRSRLAGTRMPDNPAIPELPADAARWPAEFIERAASGLMPAGVLIPLIERSSGLSVLLTQRSAALKSHAGQVSFPGGRMESGDRDIAETALRETHEEVGIDPQLVSIAGYLPPSPTVTGYSVTPVVGLVADGIAIRIDPTEVDAAFEVPLEFLMERRNQRYSEREFEGVMLQIVEFQYQERRIWGATASILLQLRKLII